MKTGNYTGYCDRGYKRGSSKNNQRLIEQGLVLCGSTTVTPDPDPEPPTPPIDTNNYLVYNGVQLTYAGFELVYN